MRTYGTVVRFEIPNQFSGTLLHSIGIHELLTGAAVGNICMYTCTRA